jgi:hypothetical protein
MLSRGKHEDSSSSKSTKSLEKDNSHPNQSRGSQTRNKKKAMMKEAPMKSQSRITSYFNLGVRQDIPSPKRETKVNVLQSEILAKDEEILKIRTQKEIFENRYSVLHMENKNYKMKTQELMITLLREDASRRREIRKTVRTELG